MNIGAGLKVVVVSKNKWHAASCFVCFQNKCICTRTVVFKVRTYV